MTEANCLWEADGVHSLDSYLRNKVFDWSHETYYEVNTVQVIGLSL